jgi:hypothetical protein
LSNGIFGRDGVLNCLYLEETLGKEVDKKIEDFASNIRKTPQKQSS